MPTPPAMYAVPDETADRKPGEILSRIEALKKRASALEETAGALVADLGPILQACPELQPEKGSPLPDITSMPDESLTTHLLNQALRFHLGFEAAVKDLCKELDDAGFEAETKAFIEVLAEDGCKKVGPADVREYLRWKDDDTDLWAV